MAYHQLAQETTDPSAPPASSWKIYFKSGGLYIEDSSGNVTGPLGVGISAGTLAFSGDNLASPNTTTGTQDNVSASGLSVFGWNGASASTVDGFTNGSADRALIVYNMTSSQTLTLAHEAGGSTAANRIHLPNGTSLSIAPYQAVMLVYDATTSRWYLSGGGGGSTYTGTQPITVSGSAISFTPNGAATKATPVAADEIVVGDSAASFAAKVSTLSAVTLDQLGAPAGNVAWNSKKITGLANGSGAQDAAAFGQIPTSLFWVAVPGSPTRASGTSITLTDTGGANNYQYLLGRGTVLKWTESGTVRQAMVTVSAYGSNTVTLTIMGDTMASIDANSLKFATEKASVITLMIPGSIGATLNDASMRYFCPMAYHVFGATPFHGAAGTTNATTYTISKNSAAGAGTILASALSIASGSTSGNDQTTTSATTTAAGDYLTANITGVSTTPATDAYINIYVFPDLNQWYT